MRNGEEITRRRKDLNMTQDILAGAACVSRSTVQRAERGLPVSAESLRSIHAVLGIVPDGSLPAATVPAAVPATPVEKALPAGTAVPFDRRKLIASDLAILLAAGLLIPFLPGLASLLGGAPVREFYSSHSYWVNVAYFVVHAACIALLGRCAWRRLVHPGCDEVRLQGIWRSGARRPWRAFAVPGIRWYRGGEAAGTWKGGLLAGALVVLVLYAFHLPTFAPMLPAPSGGAGYGSDHRASAAWSVQPGSPLHEAGLRVGDQLVSIGDVPVTGLVRAQMLVLESEGRALAFKVSRPVSTGAEWVYATEIVDLTVAVGRHPTRDCMAGIPCGWVGDLRGLFTPAKLPPSPLEQVGTFVAELASVARMAVDADHRGLLVPDAGYGYVATFDWARFLMVASGGLPFLRYAMALLLALACLRDFSGPWGRNLRGRWHRPAFAGRSRVPGRAGSGLRHALGAC